jgi:ParB-like nuclease domain
MKKKPTPEAVHPPAQTAPILVAFSAIIADHAWNARSGDYQTSDSDADEGRGTVGLAESLEARGQDEPVDIRPHPTLKGKFLLIDGFRRLAAAELLQARASHIKGLPFAHLLCRLQALSEADARMLNIAKGGNRHNLKPADLAYGISEALRLGKTLHEIHLETGKSKQYVSTLAQIANSNRFDEKIFTRWRTEGLPLGVDEIMLHIFQPNIPLDKQADVVRAILTQKRDNPRTRGRGAWYGAATRQAKELGWTLGRLVYKEVLPEVAIRWENAVMAVCNLGFHQGDHTRTIARPEQVKALVQVAEEMFAAGRSGTASPWSSRRETYERNADQARRQKSELPRTKAARGRDTTNRENQ